MDEFLLKGVTVRKLDDELRVGASWDNCTLIVRPHPKACSLQLKFGKRVYSCGVAHAYNTRISKLLFQPGSYKNVFNLSELPSGYSYVYRGSYTQHILCKCDL